MSILHAPSVQAEPYVKLSNWMLLEGAQEIRYFVGRCADTGQSRISTAIRYFDPVKRRGTTYSGRVYALDGLPGIDADIRHVLERWLEANQMSTWRDVSDELVTLMTASTTLSKKIDEQRRRRVGDVTLLGKNEVSVHE